ncbi:MAG: VanW family protein [Lachnospiraceae bacterium]
MSSRKGKIAAKRKQAMRRKQLIILGRVMLILLCVFGVGYFGLYNYVHRDSADVIRDNIYIGETEVSGMKAEEARAALAGKLDEYGEMQFTFKLDDDGTTAETIYRDLGLSFQDADQYIEAALNYGRECSLWSCFWKIKKLERKSYVVDVTYAIDQEQTEALLNEIVVPHEKPAVNAGISRSAGEFIYTDEEDGWTVNLEATRQAAEEYLNQNEGAFGEGAVTVAKNTDSPEITVSQLQTIQDELGTFGTEAGGGDRAKNLVTGAAFIDGTIVMPGEEVSAYEMTAPYTTENGYYEGSAYENGQVVSSIGGGICQVSTTLYNAALNAELEITDRAPHSMQVNYVKPSRDAAIAGDYKDLKFKNNYDTPIYIQSYISESNVLTMTIYGQETREAGRELNFTSETLETLNPEGEPKYVTDADKNIGYMEQTQSSRSGMEARLVKTVTVNGEVVSEEVVNTSTYNATAGVVSVGTASDNSDAAAVMATAIETQSKEKIQQAITQAQAIIQQGGDKSEAEEADEE